MMRSSSASSGSRTGAIVFWRRISAGGLWLCRDFATGVAERGAELEHRRHSVNVVNVAASTLHHGLSRLEARAVLAVAPLATWGHARKSAR